ncbi:MAG: response regulator transcription factor [Caldilineaceae bacterium]
MHADEERWYTISGDQRMQSNPIYKVIIVDDHHAVRNALSTVILTNDDMELAGVAVNGKQAVQLCQEVQPDIVLMDIRMPQMDGIKATQTILAKQPHIIICALTSFLEPELIQGMMQAGASGYLLKDLSAEELTTAVLSACTGQSVLNKEAYRIIFGQREPSDTQHTVDSSVA